MPRRCCWAICASKNYEDLIVVSPDVGGVVRARALAKQLSCDLAIIDKRRPKANVSEVMHVIGEIDGRNCVIMDDMIDTAGTLVKAAEVLKERGAKKVYAYCTHPIFSGPAIERIAQRPSAGRSGGHRHHSAERCGQRLQENSPIVRGTADRRDDPAHCQGRFGHEFVLGPGKPVLIEAKSRLCRSQILFKPESHWSRWTLTGVSYEIRRF